MSIRDLYFDWMSRKVLPNEWERSKYSKLLRTLNENVFYFTIPRDKNRYIDGIDLRYRFGDEMGIDEKRIDQEFDISECSVFEMMVALCLRCEENIMGDPDYGNRTGNWFKEMIDSLKLSDMTNDRFDEDWVNYRIDCLLNHEYEPNGKGGLFTVDSPREDMRNVEIWYQMCWYLNSLLREK